MPREYEEREEVPPSTTESSREAPFSTDKDIEMVESKDAGNADCQSQEDARGETKEKATLGDANDVPSTANIDYEKSHALDIDRHAPEMINQDLHDRMEKENLKFATRFESHDAVAESRAAFLEQNQDALQAREAEIQAQKDSGQETEPGQLRYCGNAQTDNALGDGIDRDGNRIDGIRDVRSVLDYNLEDRKWHEVTIYPDAREHKKRKQ